MFEDCADEIWQLEHFPTRNEQLRLGPRMDSHSIANILPVKTSSNDKGSSEVTWLESPPSSGDSMRGEKKEGSELPAAAHLLSCECSPWGCFGNEASDIDLYTYAALHVKIPQIGTRARPADQRLKRAPVKRTRAVRKRRASQVRAS
jgi:hypothetical protein